VALNNTEQGEDFVNRLLSGFLTSECPQFSASQRINLAIITNSGDMALPALNHIETNGLAN
jgi:hypothetical protein